MIEQQIDELHQTMGLAWSVLEREVLFWRRTYTHG